MKYFDDAQNKHFSFQSFADGLAEDVFGVINFKGYEAISKTYDFEVMLVSSKKDIDLEDVLQAQAVFTIHRAADDNVLYNGILAEFDQLHESNDFIFYRARLVPKLWWLTLTHHNQVFLNQSVTSFVEDALRDGGLESADFEIGALTGYEEIDYICQYDESHFNFASRWLERQGIYYYFSQQSDGEVLVLADTKFSHEALKQGADLFYNPASGLEGKHLGEAIGTFTCRQKQLPKEIILKDYNYELPSMDITSRADVDIAGRGVSYLYGECFLTAEEGERLAHIRAEELLCQKQEFFGESTVPYIMPGFTFKMNNHYREDFNQEYLILEVTHEGNQSHLMSGGIAKDSGKSHNQAIYHNSFKAIPGDVQYRPKRMTEKPKISGTIHAHIDSEADGEYAQIDEQGRYKVKLPFDINDEHLDGKGSAPIRMMQPYAGKTRGMQFPLAKGTEVLLTFIEGNPDRPIIAGAVSNPETQGPVSANNQTESVIQTGGNNKIRMEDKSGSERVILESPAANSWLRIGSTNDPITLNGSSPWYIPMGATFYDPKANAHLDGTNTVTGSNLVANRITNEMKGEVAEVDTTSPGMYFLHYEHTGTEAGAKPYTATRKVIVYDPASDDDIELQGSECDGIRIQSAGNLWMEARSRYGEYYSGKPPYGSIKDQTNSDDPSQNGDLLANFGDAYNPTGLQNYKTRATETLASAIAASHVHVSSLDTFTTQEGNIYDFGGYWKYSLGNSYNEDHIDQQAVLNAISDTPKVFDLLDIGGPGWSAINFPADASRGLSSADTDIGGDYANGKLWVDKKYGNSYEFTSGDTMSVQAGSTLGVIWSNCQITVEGDAEGRIWRWESTSPGLGDAYEKQWNSAGTLLFESHTNVQDSMVTTSEKKYDRSPGGGVYSTVDSISTGQTSSSFTWSKEDKAEASVSTGGNITSETFLGGQISNENYVGGKISMENYVGIDLGMKNFAGGKVDIELTAAMILEIRNLEVELTLTGLSVPLHTNKIDTVANDISTLASGIASLGIDCKNSMTSTEMVATIKLIA